LSVDVGAITASLFVSVSYAFKLLLQEMSSLNIAPRMLIKERV